MKKFAVPLQAFAALFICAGMAWMIFVLAGLDPTPPTAIDLRAKNTQDLSFVNMNSTAVAMAKDMIGNLIPTPSGPIVLPVTGNGTSTPVPTTAVTLVALSRSSQTPASFSLFSFLFQPTATKEKPPRHEPILIPTLLPTDTQAPPPTATNLPTQTQPPSSTPIPSTRTPTVAPPTATKTSVPPTNTLEPSSTPVPPSATSVAPTSIPPTVPPATVLPATDTPAPVVATPESNTHTPVP